MTIECIITKVLKGYKMTKPNRFNFRVWDKETSTMWYGGFSVHATGAIKPTPLINRGDLVLMQSTGLLDKNGKEIFDGDILKDNFNNSPSCLVTWISFENMNTGYFGLWINHLKLPKEEQFCCAIPLSYNTCKNFEIIGNNYENPELIKEKIND